jgi:hypothetical protein
MDVVFLMYTSRTTVTLLITEVNIEMKVWEITKQFADIFKVKLFVASDHSVRD